MADDPARQHAAAGAAAHVHPLRVDVPAADDGIHAGHQIIVVHAGIGTLDRVAKGAAVAGAAAWIGIEHHVAIGGEILELIAERHVVHAVRTAVDLHEQRVLLARVEPRRLDDPSLDARAAARCVPDLLDAAEFDAFQHVGIHVREAGDRLGALEVEAHDIGRIVGIAARSDRVEVARHGGEGQHLHAVRHATIAAVQPGEIDVARSLLRERKKDTAPVGTPAQLAGIAVVRRERPHPAPVDSHLPHFLGTIGLRAEFMTGERDCAAIGRHHRIGPSALLRDQRLDGAAFHVNGEEVRLPIAIIGVRIAEAVEHDGATIGRPVVVRPAAELARRVIAVRELARRAAFRGHEKQLRRSLLDVADAVAPIVEAIDDARRRRPFGTLRRGRHTDLPRRLTLHQHREREGLAVRRPAQGGRVLAHARDL